jgi:hypothetical protein
MVQVAAVGTPECLLIALQDRLPVLDLAHLSAVTNLLHLTLHLSRFDYTPSAVYLRRSGDGIPEFWDFSRVTLCTPAEVNVRISRGPDVIY